MTLREVARCAVLAHRAGDATALKIAIAELGVLTSDDRPEPVDLVEMCESILIGPYQTDKPSCMNCGGLMDKSDAPCGFFCPTCGMGA